jgi:tetratricopeptide (TPR) repeat protein
LAVVTLAVYWPVLGYDFVHLDDTEYVTRNSRVLQGLTWANAGWAFTDLSAGFWHPLTWLSYMLDVELFGRNAGAMHGTNLLLHTGSTILLFCVLRQLSGALWRSAMVAALFALHPLHVEAVAWVAERKEVLGAFFGFCSLFAYARYARRPPCLPITSGCYWLSIVFFVCGLMSKTMIVTLPLVMLVLDWWPLRRFDSPAGRRRVALRLIAEKAPLLALSLLAGGVTVYAEGNIGALVATEVVPMSSRFANVLHSYAQYLAQTVWPAGMAVPYLNTEPVSLLTAARGGLIFCAISFTAILWLRRRPWFAAGWCWFVVTLLPVSGLIQIANFARADRYTYVPLVGVFIMLAWLLTDFLQRMRVPSIATATLAGILLAATGFITRKQLEHWQNTETLFRHTLAVNSRNDVAYDMLGIVAAENGRIDEAIENHRRAIQINPRNVSAWNNLGCALARAGRHEDAIAGFQVALQVRPDYGDARYNLGNSLAATGKTDEAVAQYRLALKQRPDSPEIHNNLARVLAAKGQLDDAVAHYRRAMQLMPQSALPHMNLADVLLARGDREEARENYLAAIAANPGSADAHYRLGMFFAAEKEMGNAILHLREAVRLRPDSVQSLNSLAWILATARDGRLRDGADAVRLAERAAQLGSFKNPFVLDTLSAAYAESGRFADAVEMAQKAVDAANVGNNKRLAEEIQTRLQAYRSGQPYRE